MKEQTINKVTIVEALAEKHGTTIMLAESMIESFIDMITDQVSQGNKISIGRLGIFRKKVRLARKCRNPRTGAVVMVGDVNIVKFTPASSFKEKIK